MGILLVSFLLTAFVLFVLDDELAIRPYIPEGRAKKMLVVAGIFTFAISVGTGLFINTL